jgi:hypothetical protein
MTFEERMDEGLCVNCGDRESNEEGVLCDECRMEMWEGERT